MKPSEKAQAEVEATKLRAQLVAVENERDELQFQLEAKINRLVAAEKERDEATGALAAALFLIEKRCWLHRGEGWASEADRTGSTAPHEIYKGGDDYRDRDCELTDEEKAFLASPAADLAARHDAEIERRALEKAVGPDSGTRAYVLAFAKMMEAKLAKNRHKGDREGWINDDTTALLDRLHEEVGELVVALGAALTPRGSLASAEAAAAWEAVDVANFAMMLADHMRALAHPTKEPSPKEKP